MICSTSTLSERTEKSDMSALVVCALARNRFPAVAAPRLPCAPGQKLWRLGDAGAEDPQRSHQCPDAGHLDLRRLVADLRVAVRIAGHGLPVAEQATPRAVEDRA